MVTQRTRERSRKPSLEPLEGRALLSASSPTPAPAHAEAAAARTGGTRALMNLTYAPQLHLDLYLPVGPTPAGGRPVVLALPGGGWRWVSRGDLGTSASQLTNYGYAVAVADYTYSGGTPGTSVWPTNLNDVRSAVRWLKGNAGKYGIDPNRVAVWGESAGGNLAALVGTFPDDPSAPAPRVRSRGNAFGGTSARVQAVIDFYGPADLTALYRDAPKSQAYLNTFLGGTPDQVPDRYIAASPVTHVDASSPPFLIEQGVGDTAVPQAQAAELADRLTAAGVPVTLQYQYAGHGFRFQPSPGVDLLPTMLAFLDSSLNRRAKPTTP